MTFSERLDTFLRLGAWLRDERNAGELAALAQQAYLKNGWFTPNNTRKALSAIAYEFLTPDALTPWAKQNVVEPTLPKQVGVVMAGNIPAVGFHDLLCVLLSGHQLLAKISSQDLVLIQYLIQKITELTPAFAQRITVAERLNAADAFIATGSDNTSRYFEYYFGQKPHIIRRNRTSVGLLMGEESEEELAKLGDDILSYFGLGCRNVATVLVPDDYDVVPLLRVLELMVAPLIDHHKYCNNYDYNKSVYLVNGVPHWDNGGLLLTESDALVSPISVLYLKRYRTQTDAQTFLSAHADKIQVVASAGGWLPGRAASGSVPFGQTQRPGLSDYADGVDTMAFLRSLSV